MSAPAASGAPTGAPEILLNLLTTYLLPVIVIPFILQSHWKPGAKRLVAGACCFGVAVIATALNQTYSFRFVEGADIWSQILNFGSWLLLNSATIIGGTELWFKKFWRETGIPTKIEAATSAKKPEDDPGYFPTSLHKSQPNSGTFGEIVVEPLEEPLEDEPLELTVDEPKVITPPASS